MWVKSESLNAMATVYSQTIIKSRSFMGTLKTTTLLVLEKSFMQTVTSILVLKINR